jgi:RHS repeat-associated protein
MQLGSDAQIPDGLLAAMTLLNEKPHQGVPSWKSALHQGISEANCTAAIGIRASEQLNRVWPRYTGKERDAESGLDYFGARYYGSNMGRFTSPDGFSDGSDFDNPQSWNLYSYVRNNPLTNTDPDGHDCVNTSNYSKDGTVTVTSGTSCASDPAKYGTYVNGTVDASSITATSKASGTDFGYNFTSYDGQSGGAGVITQAPSYGPLEGPANLAGAAMIGSGTKAIGAFVAGSVVIGGTLGLAGVPSAVLGAESGSLAGVGRTGASVANRLWHIFGNPEHGLGSLVAKYGSQLAAYSAILNAAQAQITATGNFVGVAIQVGGTNIQVNGTVIDGVVKISTAYIGK